MSLIGNKVRFRLASNGFLNGSRLCLIPQQSVKNLCSKLLTVRQIEAPRENLELIRKKVTVLEHKLVARLIKSKLPLSTIGRSGAHLILNTQCHSVCHPFGECMASFT